VASGGDDDVSGDVGEGEREELEGRANVCEVREREGGRPMSTARRGERRGGGQLLGMHAVLAVEQLLACLAKPSSSLERWLGWAGGWACWVAPGKPFSFSLSCFVFFFYFSVTLGLY